MPTAVTDALSIARYHILGIAMAATVVFGWLITGRYLPWVAFLVGLDWCFINLINRVTDLEEDRKNGIPGTERVAARRRLLTLASVAALGLSFAVTHYFCPALTPLRLAVQAIGLGYNYRVIPTPRGRTRFKEMYLLKNVASAILFVLTCFGYPLLGDLAARRLPWSTIGALVAFFFPLELTYEVLYDVRDLAGDRQEGIPTFPVVHGLGRARQIIDGLLFASAAPLAIGLLTHTIGVREALMLCAPATQLALYRRKYPRLDSRDCILITHLGTAQLTVFLLGTALWQALGLPPNLWL